MMVRRVLLVSFVLLVAYIIGVVGIRMIRDARIPAWEKNLGRMNQIEVLEGGKFSVQYQQSYNRINALLYAEQWSAQEVQELLGFIEIPMIPDEAVTDTDQFDLGLLELWMGRHDALMIISERIRVDAPIDDDQRQVLIDQVTAGLYQDQSYRYFSFAVADVTRSGLADMPGPIRDRILYIYSNPRQFFGKFGLDDAENIRRQLKARGTFVLQGEDHG